jgi:hypothetical protein
VKSIERPSRQLDQTRLEDVDVWKGKDGVLCAERAFLVGEAIGAKLAYVPEVFGEL